MRTLVESRHFLSALLSTLLGALLLYRAPFPDQNNLLQLLWLERPYLFSAIKWAYIAMLFSTPYVGFSLVFSLAYIATGGGPNYATYFYVYHLFKNAFEFSRMGYAAAMAWVFFLIILALTLVQFRFSNRWVFYAGADAREETTDAK